MKASLLKNQMYFGGKIVPKHPMSTRLLLVIIALLVGSTMCIARKRITINEIQNEDLGLHDQSIQIDNQVSLKMPMGTEPLTA